MSSSDSEDDCFGNLAQKLHKMKNKYSEDKIETTNILEDSSEDTASVPQEDLTRNKKATAEEEPSEVLERLLKESKAKKGRVTRSRTTENSEEIDAVLQENLSVIKSSRGPRGGRGRSNQRERTAVSVNTHSRRGGRSRSNRRTGRHSDSGRLRFGRDRSCDIIHNVGNTYEYPDLSANQELFSKPNMTDGTNSTSDVIVIDNELTAEDNEELSVKVYWQNSEYYKFTIRKHEKLSQIFDFFARKENVSPDKLLFMYNEKIFKSDDTPDTINYNFVKFIHAGIVNQSLTSLSNECTVKSGIKIKFQCQNVKKPFEVTISLDENMSLAMSKCAEHLKMPLDNLIFEFDGDCITGKNTARGLELEDGECIDVKIVK